MPSTPETYPAQLQFDPPEKITNWRPLVQWLLAIPHWIVLYVLRFVAEILAIGSWFIILFTGKLPDGIAGFQVMYQRYSARTALYTVFMQEEYPPFAFDTTVADPRSYPRTTVDVRPDLEDRNRLTVAFRLILAIPQLLIVSILALAALVAAVIALFAVLFTGRWPEGLRQFVLNVEQYWVRVEAYTLLLTDEYPPFALT
jgi:hypothetical protein